LFVFLCNISLLHWHWNIVSGLITLEDAVAVVTTAAWFVVSREAGEGELHPRQTAWL
jgi:hypothetical protein